MRITEEELNYGDFIEIKCGMCGKIFLYLRCGGKKPTFCDECVKYRQYLRNKFQHLLHLGTTSLSPSFSGDFEEEKRIIKQERKKLRLRKKK